MIWSHSIRHSEGVTELIYFNPSTEPQTLRVKKSVSQISTLTDRKTLLWCPLFFLRAKTTNPHKKKSST